jgi:interferon gamma-inducible protein 30
MQAEGLPAIMNITEYFDGMYYNGKFICEHGQTECAGNMLELCAYNLTVQTSKYGWWSFGLCMQNDPDNIPDNAAACATQANLDFDPIQACANGKLGTELFVESINFCNQMNIQGTPTVIINGVVYLGGADNPLSVVCNAYTGTKPSGCTSANRGASRPLSKWHKKQRL